MAAEHPGDPFGLGLQPAQIGGCGIDDMQNRQSGCIPHILVPTVGGIAGNGDGGTAGLFQPGDAAQALHGVAKALGQLVEHGVGAAGAGLYSCQATDYKRMRG